MESLKHVVVEATNWTCCVQTLCLCGFKSLLKHVLDWLCNKIWIGTLRTVCPICVQFDVTNLLIFLFLSPFILSSPTRTLSWCLIPTVNPLSSLCAALLTYSTPSCKPITLNRVLDSDRSKQISSHRCHHVLISLTSFNIIIMWNWVRWPSYHRHHYLKGYPLPPLWTTLWYI